MNYKQNLTSFLVARYGVLGCSHSQPWSQCSWQAAGWVFLELEVT